MVYKNGELFTEKLEENLKLQYARVHKHRKASLIIVDGGVGEGKTTLGVEMLDYFNKLAGLPPASLEIKDHPQIGIGGKEFMQNLRLCYSRKLPAVLYDEGGDFNRKGAISRFNQMIMRIFETFRGFKIIVILCLPNFAVLENDLYDAKIPRMLVHCQGRGDSHGTFKVYSLRLIGWLRYWYEKLPKGSKHKSFARVSPNFWGHFHDLPRDRSAALDRLSTKGKIEVLTETEIKAEGLVSYQDLARKLNRSVSWVRQACLNNKIKHKKVIKRVKYFGPSVLDRLVDLKDDRY